MSKLQDLIQKFCPDGVEVRELREICKITKGVQLNKEKLLAKGPYPVQNGGINPSGFWHEFNFRENLITISQGGASAGFVNFIKTPFWAGAHCFVLIEPCLEINYRFLFYHLKNKEYELMKAKQGAGIPGLAKQVLETFKVPLPPLPVQAEIVRILDTFTALIDLLKAELVARRKQYEYYRDQLLTFGEDVPRCYIGDVCSLFAGGDAPKNRMSKEKTDEYTIPIFSNGVGDNALYGYTDIPKITKRCVTISARGTIGYCELRKEPFYPIVRLITAIPNDSIIPDFLYYIIQTIEFIIPKSGIPQLTIPMLKNYQIPLPPLPEQERIVSILDRFNALCTDLCIGIPAEIKARQKQYEYYRDQLLTFKIKD